VNPSKLPSKEFTDFKESLVSLVLVTSNDETIVTSSPLVTSLGFLFMFGLPMSFDSLVLVIEVFVMDEVNNMGCIKQNNNESNIK
jgi:hypothetical protein